MTLCAFHLTNPMCTAVLEEMITKLKCMMCALYYPFPDAIICQQLAISFVSRFTVGCIV